jgi:hypothetical protein
MNFHKKTNYTGKGHFSFKWSDGNQWSQNK